MLSLNVTGIEPYSPGALKLHRGFYGGIAPILRATDEYNSRL